MKRFVLYTLSVAALLSVQAFSQRVETALISRNITFLNFCRVQPRTRRVHKSEILPDRLHPFRQAFPRS
jgi:hypothetical protein